MRKLQMSGSAWSVVAIFTSAGIAHLAIPKFFDAIVPSWMPGSPRTTTYVSGAFELASAALIVNPSTRRIGGWLALGTFVGIFPANVWAALQGGVKDAPPPLDSAAAAWGRLPLQFPMIWLAWKVAHEHKGAR